MEKPRIQNKDSSEGISLRRYRPFLQRQRMYARVLELRNEGKSYNEIGRIILEEFGEFLSKSMISYWCRRCHTPYRDGLGEPEEDQRMHKLRLSPELAYVIGATIGDGCTKLEGEYMYAIVLAVKYYDFAEIYGKCAAIVVGREEPYRPFWDEHSKRWVVKVKSKGLYELLKKPLNIERIRHYIECCEECMASFIRGFADAEGSVDKNKKSLGRILIANTDPRIIRYTAKLLGRLGIEAKTYKRNMKRRFIIEGKYRKRWKKTISILTIRRKISIKRYRDIVGFSIKRKQMILKMVE